MSDGQRRHEADHTAALYPPVWQTGGQPPQAAFRLSLRARPGSDERSWPTRRYGDLCPTQL